MSLNHIIKDIVSDTERLSVKFDVCEVNQLVIDGGAGTAIGSIDPDSTGEVFTSDILTGITSQRATACCRTANSFEVGYIMTATMPDPAQAVFSITAPYPTKIRTLVAADPNLINVNGIYTIITARTRFRAYSRSGKFQFIWSRSCNNR